MLLKIIIKSTTRSRAALRLCAFMLQPTSCRFSDVWVNLHILWVSKLAELLSSPVSLSGWCFHHHKTDSILFLIEQFQIGISHATARFISSKIIYPVHISRYFVAKSFHAVDFTKYRQNSLEVLSWEGCPPCQVKHKYHRDYIPFKLIEF